MIDISILQLVHVSSYLMLTSTTPMLYSLTLINGRSLLRQSTKSSIDIILHNSPSLCIMSYIVKVCE